MNRTALIIGLCLSIAVDAAAASRRQSTSRGHLKPVAETTATMTSDTVSADTLDITITGYDKPVNATKETFFVVNHTDLTLTELTVTFTYSDMQGRQLHQVTHTVSCDIPPSGTRMLTVPTWDRQHTFRYHLSAPTRKQSTPYRVSHRIERVIASPINERHQTQ